MSGIRHCMFFSAWLLLHNKTLLRFIHVIVCIMNLLPFYWRAVFHCMDVP